MKRALCLRILFPLIFCPDAKRHFWTWRQGKTKIQFAFEAGTAKALFGHDRSVGVSVMYLDCGCSTSATTWLAGWCTYGLLRRLERVHQSLKPQRSELNLMSVVKNVKSILWWFMAIAETKVRQLNLGCADPTGGRASLQQRWKVSQVSKKLFR